MGTVFDLTLDDLSERLAAWGEPGYRARQVYAGLWGRAVGYGQMTDLPEALRRRLASELPTGVEVLDEREADGGATRKALLRLSGRHVVETVLMGYQDRATVCVSSQAGCAMGCVFCATGQMGLLGNLTAGEIAAQVHWARGRAGALGPGTAHRLTNVVFMGMGEPLSNYRGTRDAIARLVDPHGSNLGARHVTVSTVGVAPGIRRLAEDLPQVGLAVSLHAADDDLRGELVPADRLWPLAEVESAVADWRARTGRRPSIEWAMIDRVNDGPDQADRLIPIVRRLGAHVNLIPMNPVPGSPFRGSPHGRILAFAARLRTGGVNATIRDTRGREIQAACGQLKWEALERATSRAGTPTTAGPLRRG